MPDYNERFDDSEEETSIVVDAPDEPYSFKVLDVAGAVIHTAGNVFIALGNGLKDVSECFRIGAWHQRSEDVYAEEAAKDRVNFDAITSLALLPEELS